MKKIFEKIKIFFGELRKKPENVRQIWLWVFVSISLVVVFVVWIFVTKENMPVVAQPEPTPEAVIENNSSGFFHILKVGWDKTWNFVVKIAKDIGGFVGNLLAGFFSFTFQLGRKVARVFNGMNSYFGGELAAYFKSLASLMSGEF